MRIEVWPLAGHLSRLSPSYLCALCGQVDTVFVQGRSLEEVRKFILGGAGEAVVLGLQAPGVAMMTEFVIPRTGGVEMRFKDEGEDCDYSDGWSEKKFDSESCVDKVC